MDSPRNATAGGTGRENREVLESSKVDGRDILHKLLQIPRRFADMPEDWACRMLYMSGDGKVSSSNNGG